MLILTMLFSLMNINVNDSLITPYEKGNGNQTCTYEECIEWYEKLDAASDYCKLFKTGKTSIGKPLHVLVIDKNKNFDPLSVSDRKKMVLLINNGIHPGEPDGIDASMMFARDVLSKPEMNKVLDNCTVVIIAAYNISGMLNRNSTTRVNQDGPEQYGFRGNRQHLDLNRDFIKCDSKEAQIFNLIFTNWMPDIFIDTHVSNGADYQYVMTLIATQSNKLSPVLGKYEREKLLPSLYSSMKEVGFEMTPYVYEKDIIPDSGIIDFLDNPRYSTGYAALHHCIGFMPETHMLKPYKERVMSTYEFIHQTLKITSAYFQTIIDNHNLAIKESQEQKTFDIHWKLNENKKTLFNFKGYEAGYKPSDVSGLPRLFYDKSKPFTKPIDYFNQYDVNVKVDKPMAYLIPQCYEKVIELLQLNHVGLTPIKNDITIELNDYYIEDYTSSKTAYENHFPHNNISLRKSKDLIQCYKGDYIVMCNQPVNRYIIECLEPASHDSYFVWNFFDGFLMQKEGFSDYVWEDLAAEVLKNNPEIKNQLEAKKSSDKDFANDAQAQLRFVYELSEYAEKDFMRYPVYRIENEEELKKLFN